MLSIFTMTRAPGTSREGHSRSRNVKVVTYLGVDIDQRYVDKIAAHVQKVEGQFALPRPLPRMPRYYRTTFCKYLDREFIGKNPPILVNLPLPQPAGK